MNGFEIPIVTAFQALSNGFTDTLFQLITLLGDEYFFMAVAFFFYWCIDKRAGFKIINVYFISSISVEGIKSLVKRPRPYNYDPVNVKSIGEETSGYSFPSGHSHSIASLGTQASLYFKKRWVIILSAVLAFLVAFSRIFLGQHFLSDVLTGLVLGCGLAFGLSYLFEFLKDKEERIMFVVAPLCIVLAIVFASFNIKVGDNVYKVLGAYSAITLGYFFEKRYVKFDVKTVWYKNLIKLFIGGVIVLIFHQLMKFILPEDVPFIFNFIRYFCVGIAGTLGACEIFKLLKLYEVPLDEDFE